MIIKSSFRRAGGLEAHLRRSDTNEAVNIRKDQFRGASDLHGALRLMAGLAKTNPKVERAYVHMVISPDHRLTEAELTRTLTVIEAEYGISSEACRAVIEHEKGNRPSHFHAVYPIVDPETGRAIKSHKNFERDELISRLLETEFGERVTPGPRLAANIAECRRRGLEQQVNTFTAYLPQRNTDPLDRTTRQQAARLGIDGVAWSQRVANLFEEAGRNLDVFGQRVGPAGLRLAKGREAILIIDDKTGHHQALVRGLRREAKAAGRSLAITETDVARTFPNAQPFATARDAGLSAAQTRASAEVDREWSRSFFETQADADAAALSAFRQKRGADRAADVERGRRELKVTLAARRQQIIDTYRRRDEIRRLRVDRAFRAAGLFGSPELRRIAFALAAAGILMTGGSLAFALIGAGVLARSLPHAGRVRRYARAAKTERARDLLARTAELDRAYGEVKRTFARPSAPVRFSFNQVAKPDRILAGFVATVVLAGTPIEEHSEEVRRAMAVLGPEIVDGLTRMLERGSSLQVRRLQHWYRGVAPDGRRLAVEAALRRHSEVQPDSKGTGTVQAREGKVRRRARSPSQTRSRDDDQGR